MSNIPTDLGITPHNSPAGRIGLVADWIDPGHIIRVAVGLMLVAFDAAGEIFRRPGGEGERIFDAVGIDVGTIGADEDGRVAVRTLVIIAVARNPADLDIEWTEDFRGAKQDVLNVLVGAGEGGNRVRAVVPTIEVDIEMGWPDMVRKEQGQLRHVRDGRKEAVFQLFHGVPSLLSLGEACPAAAIRLVIKVNEFTRPWPNRIAGPGLLIGSEMRTTCRYR